MERSERSRIEAGRRAAQTARARYGDDFHVRRGQQAIATARARGKFPEPLVKACEVCKSQFSLPPSRTRIARCPACVQLGCGRCGSCDAVVQIPAGRSGRVLCKSCKSEGLHGRPTAKRQPLVTVVCRGPERMNRGARGNPVWRNLPWKTPRAPACMGTYSYKRWRLLRMRRYDSARRLALAPPRRLEVAPTPSGFLVFVS